ncbi:hypothetical protein CKAH01_17550 [Colletotrichum kahawae]|uniref:Uncharacterized protein n=1 Tax=Colletotrichum kahawae TaxID=34407 RepID=A0AAD9Y9H2_COLKA|nr:hypothetical protein CKAH01_17550 [Colletotrichum kahawae]
MRPVSILTLAFAAFTGVEAFRLSIPEHRGLVMAPILALAAPVAASEPLEPRRCKSIDPAECQQD